MWNCSRCGEAIEDNVGVCWRCGTRHDSAATEDHQEEPDDPAEPDEETELSESDETSDDEMTSCEPPERALTQENLAALLLRFLGLYLTAYGLVHVVSVFGHIFLLATRSGIDEALRRYFPLESLIQPGAELVIGLYFLIGGQWVYDKILTPVRRIFPDDKFPETEDDGAWRTWKSADGVYTVKAKLLRVAGETVQLLKEDGSTITVERSKLSEDDWNWATHQ